MQPYWGAGGRSGPRTVRRRRAGPWYIDMTGNRLADGTKFQVWEQTGNPPYPENAEQECGPENASGQPVESGLCVP
jgi:hypothetical protein